MAAKIGGFLGLFVGFIVWRLVGGIGGLLLALFLVVPIASAIFIGLFSAIGGGGKGKKTPSQDESPSAVKKKEQKK
jgi:hypothetical protein